jgi:type IV secretory pathway TraG/TraD family ATPase VirD4
VIKFIALVVVLALLGVVKARLRKRLPRHRSRWTRVRLHLRLHPGPGFASSFEVWLRWGRFASFRESGRSRPSLSARSRIRDADSHSAFLGRAHRWLSLRLPVQFHALLIGPPRAGKSALLSKKLMRHDGAAVSTSSKGDMFALTSGLRALRGPVFTFNPQGVGGIPSTVRWNPLEGCREPGTAIRRADAFANAASAAGTEDGSYWTSQASDMLRASFQAGAVADTDMRQVSRWVLDETTSEAVTILITAGSHDWAKALASLDGPAEKTSATVRSVMRRALAYTGDPALAAATTPLPGGDSFDVDDFLLRGGTLYMIARSEKDSPVAPLFAALASEIQYRATQLGSRLPGGRHDPPLLLALDEVTQICPVPLPQWLADSGGQGVQVWAACHGLAQLRDRWGAAGSQSVLDTTDLKVLYPGITDAETLRAFADLTGTHAHRGRGKDAEAERHEDVVTPEMIRRLPPGFGLLIRGGNAPVIAKLARGWKDRAYKRARRQGWDVAAMAARAGARAAEVLVLDDPRREPVTTLRGAGDREPTMTGAREMADALPAPTADGERRAYPWGTPAGGDR